MDAIWLTSLMVPPPTNQGPEGTSSQSQVLLPPETPQVKRWSENWRGLGRDPRAGLIYFPHFCFSCSSGSKAPATRATVFMVS